MANNPHWLLLGALILTAVLQSGQGEKFEEEEDASKILSKDIEELNIDQLHNANTSEFSRTPSKSKFKKFTATKKNAKEEVEKVAAEAEQIRRKPDSERPPKQPVSEDDKLDDLMERMVTVLENVSQDLHTMVQAISGAKPDEPKKNLDNALSPLKPQTTKPNKPQNAIRGLDRYLDSMLHIAQDLLKEVVKDTKNNRKSSNSETVDSKMEEMLTAPAEMMNLLSSFMFQDMSAMEMMFSPSSRSSPSTHRTATISSDQKTSTKHDQHNKQF